MIDTNWLIPFGAGLMAGIVLMLLLYSIKKETTKRIAEELISQSQEERVRDLEAIIGRLKESFTAISYAALHQNSEQFLTIAGSTLKSQTEKSEITLEKQDDGFAITRAHLTLKAKIPGIDNAKFQELAAKAEKGCPVSKLLKAEISLEASLL